MTRQAKTPRQRAQEQLDAAKRHKDRLKTKRDALRTELADVTTEHDAAAARVEYLAKHPDLVKSGDTATTGATATPRPSTTGGTTR